MWPTAGWSAYRTRLRRLVSMAGELAAFEDADPAGHSLDARFAASLAWQATPRLQLDVEADAGLSAGAPDTALMVGFADRFR